MAKPQHLLILSHACVTAINQQFFAEIAAVTGWRVTLIVPRSWRNDYGKVVQPQRWASFTGQIIEIPVWLSGNIPLHTYQAWFGGILQKLQPDLIYAHHEPYGIATFQLYLANYLTLKRPIAYFTWQNLLKNYPFPFRQTEQFVYRHSTLAFPGSQSALDVLRQKGFTKECVILPAGIDPELYAPTAAAKLAQSLRVEPDEVLIGYLGRIVEEKGLHTLLIALAKLNQDADFSVPWRLVMVGAGNYETQFDQLAADLGLTAQISRLGFVPHTAAPQYLAAFDLLMIPSETRANWKEQFGRVIIEAMACGTPVLGSTSGEIPYLIGATEGGLTFKEADADALASQLRRLLTDSQLRQTLAHQGRNNVYANYTHQALAQRFVDGFIGAVEGAQGDFYRK